jgi:L,D-transpeptidase ErfK/SrfK
MTISLRLLVLLAVVTALQGCTAMKRAQDDFPLVPREPLVAEVDGNEYAVTGGDDVIGRLWSMRLASGDTLPDIARHFGLGLNAISDANPGVDVWVPEAGTRIVLPLYFILPDAPRKGIVINLATMRLFHFTGNGTPTTVVTYPVGVGREDRPSPRGAMRVERKVHRPTWHVPASIARDHLKKGDPLPATVPPGPDNPLGDYALYLSAPSYLIHGTNKPASIGLRATNGCFRLYPEDIRRLYESTPAKTPVNIINQPYLLGQRNGVVYLEVHGATEELDSAALDTVYRRMRALEKESGRPIDWARVKTVLAEARGIPVPILELRPGSGPAALDPVEVRHPDRLRYKPPVPELRADAWAVSAANLSDKTDAARLAAIINHQGPHIPARVIGTDHGYQVVTGPFTDAREAREVVKRLKIDLELDGRLIEPVSKK